ncbi:hypothetical protein MTBBW1_760017 [Desulfamplus magnetovallimortis]|uniref:Uncharacterized protein n=1 Tax=Desulfamplus magnetovallimortis TaxID=1246637 RepID=A0A1W1HJC5_9BACT|nr:hypothetical protein MTBBW1_760017 [Desulfamplus magnetovallimortis]
MIGSGLQIRKKLVLIGSGLQIKNKNWHGKQNDALINNPVTIIISGFLTITIRASIKK